MKRRVIRMIGTVFIAIILMAAGTLSVSDAATSTSAGEAAATHAVIGTCGACAACAACTPTPVTTPQGLFMDILDSAGMETILDKTGIRFYGYAQGGYMYDTTAPQPYAGPTFLTFNNLRNTPLVDKISLNAERTVDPAKKEFDLGFRLEGIWGYDARFIHSNGLGDTQTGRYQFDPLQMYVDVALPYIPAKVRAGKWLTISGFEHFSANIYNAFGDPARALYSNSYQFFYAEPGTQTGILGTYVINPKLTADLGFTRGWNQSTRDGNSPYLDIVGRLTYAHDDKTSFVFVFTEGPEFPIGVGRGLPEGDK
ncbi:MAG: outer membrane beta-barrel protein, partial [Candidatus Omnitrophica bacterium]|nr:outer membrane beta-barrel protein [Candidatus Omnitrophota bacterium]